MDKGKLGGMFLGVVLVLGALSLQGASETTDVWVEINAL